MGNEMSNNLVAVEKILCDGFVPSDDLLHDAKHIVETAQISAYRVCNGFLVQRNWLLGRRIAVEELADTRRKNYGREIVKKLAAFLTEEFGSGFDQSSLYKYVRFYKLFPKILDSSSPKSLLSWTKIPGFVDTLQNTNCIFQVRSSLEAKLRRKSIFICCSGKIDHDELECYYKIWQKQRERWRSRCLYSFACLSETAVELWYNNLAAGGTPCIDIVKRTGAQPWILKTRIRKFPQIFL